MSDTPTPPASDRDYEQINEDRRAEAISAFEQSEIGELFEAEGNAALGDILIRKDAIAAGKFPYRLKDGYPHALARLLSADTNVGYDAYVKNEQGVWEETWESAETEAGDLQEKLIKAVHEYAMVAASRAKQLSSPSLDMWAEILVLMSRRFPSFELAPAWIAIPQNAADRVVELLIEATDRLGRDIIVSMLPPFKD